jgi:hypothetical protein
MSWGDAMTEEEWLACNDPHLVLREVRASQYERKSRLICVAFASRVHVRGCFVVDQLLGKA